MLTTLAVSLFCFVGVLTAGMFLFQNALLYLPTRYPEESLVQQAREAAVEPWPRATRDYRGLMTAPRSAEEQGTVVVFHGNAGSALNRTPYVAALTPLGYRVLLAKYPGYGARDGELGEKSLMADAASTEAPGIADEAIVHFESNHCTLASCFYAFAGFAFTSSDVGRPISLSWRVDGSLISRRPISPSRATRPSR